MTPKEAKDIIFNRFVTAPYNEEAWEAFRTIKALIEEASTTKIYSCSNCRYCFTETIHYENLAETEHQCRRHAPVKTAFSSSWPSTKPEYWCGDWKPTPMDFE